MSDPLRKLIKVNLKNSFFDNLVLNGINHLTIIKVDMNIIKINSIKLNKEILF